MTQLFLEVVNRSISASWLVGAVLLARVLLKRCPRWAAMLLWTMVAVRLVCPALPESPVSLVPSTQTIAPEIMLDWSPQIDTGIPVLNEAVNPVIAESFAPEPAASANPLQILIPVAAAVWILGMGVIGLYTLGSCWLLQRKVRTATVLRYNIYQSEYVTTPFVLGIWKPRVYLPYAMCQENILYVIAHEKAHIRRRDHWWKPLGFLMVTVHWFNPVMWLAYRVFCRDIELACDEAVIRNMNHQQRADYAGALLACSVRPSMAACPLAFGEVGVKTRIKSVMHYRKPAFWIILLALLACVALAVCFLTNPEDQGKRNAEAIVKDFSSVLEIVIPDKEYRDMDGEKQEEILREYGDLLDDYTLIARESTDGSICYIAGYYNGNAADSPITTLDFYTYGDDRNLIIDTPERIQEIRESGDYKTLEDPKYILDSSYFWYDFESGLILIEPESSPTSLLLAYEKYLDPNGGAYIRDAVSRGIAFYSTRPVLAVVVFSDKWGMVTERIPLTEAQVSQILAEETQTLAGEGYYFNSFMFYQEDEVVMKSFRGTEGVPQTIINLAMEKCGFRLEGPADIQSDIVEARLDCNWLEEPIYAKKVDLPKLKSILTGAKLGEAGSGWDAKLTIRMADGKEMVIFKCEHDRFYNNSFVFGSCNAHYLEPEEAEAFWRIFGLDPSTMEPIAAIGETVPMETEPAAPVHQEVADLAYFMELSASEKEFRDMSPEKRAEIIPEYGGLLDGYDLIARESTDGALSYIVGYWAGAAEENPLYHLRSASRGDGNRERQVLYDLRELEAAEKYEEPEEKYVIYNSYINHSSETGWFLIHPTDSGWGFNDVFNQYLRPKGREYLLDAFSRGIALSTPEGPYLEVYLISETWGEITERIPLTEEQAAQILSEPREKLDAGHGFAAGLTLGPNSSINTQEDAVYFTEARGVPQTALDLAVEKCGYRFASPKDIQSGIVEAKLECSWLDEPIYADQADLQKLQGILTGAEFGYVGGCGYGAKLTVRMEDGTELVMFKGTDGCDSAVFGSYGGYFLGDAQTRDFWNIFGVDIEAAWG